MHGEFRARGYKPELQRLDGAWRARCLSPIHAAPIDGLYGIVNLVAVPKIVYSLPADRELGLRLGARSYITKPFSTKVLISEIENALEGS